MGLAQPVQRRGRHPGAFVVARRDQSIRAHADAIGRAETTGDDLKLLPVLAHLEEAAGMRADRAVAERRLRVAEAAAARVHRIRLREIEIPLRVRLEIKQELVEAARGHHLVVEVLVEVRLAVLVQIVIARELVAAARIKFFSLAPPFSMVLRFIIAFFQKTQVRFSAEVESFSFTESLRLYKSKLCRSIFTGQTSVHLPQREEE